MNSTSKALRAVTAWQFRRIFKVVIGIVASALLLIWLAIGLAAYYWSAWWLILLFVLIPLTIIVLILSLGGWWFSGKVLPRHLSNDEKQRISKFNDKVFGLVEAARTPLPMLGILFAFDALRGRGSQRIANAINDSSSLKRDFSEIRGMFAESSRRS